jgi:phosphoserine aminotransferase
MSVMEISHRGPEFAQILQASQTRLRQLLAVPPEFHILYMQGGGLALNAAVPLNLSQGKGVDVVVSGSWSHKSLLEAGRYANAQAAADSRQGGAPGWPAPATWKCRADSAYVHFCANETIDGVEAPQWPDLRALGLPSCAVVDASSNILSRAIDWSRLGVVFAGAQKNTGPAGLTLVFVRDDLLGRALPTCPSVWNWASLAQQRSMVNTPPTYAIYIAGLMFEWIAQEGGVAEMERRALERSQRLYACIDASEGFYGNRVEPQARSRMNIPFHLKDPALTDTFVSQAHEAGLLQLKGHQSVGGLRASLYNAMPMSGVLALIDHMNAFARRYG